MSTFVMLLLIIVGLIIVIIVWWLFLRGSRKKEPLQVPYEGTEWMEIGKSLGHHKP